MSQERKPGDPFIVKGVPYWLASEVGITHTMTRTYGGVTYTDAFVDETGRVVTDTEVPPMVAKDWVLKKQRDAFKRARATVEARRAELGLPATTETPQAARLALVEQRKKDVANRGRAQRQQQ